MVRATSSFASFLAHSNLSPTQALLWRCMLLLCLVGHAASVTEHTKDGGPCECSISKPQTSTVKPRGLPVLWHADALSAICAGAALAELEEDYITRAEEQVFNIVDPGTSTQCTWSPSEKRICQGVGGRCETHDEL